MVTLGVPGFSAMGGVQFSNTAIIAGAAATLAFVISCKFFDKSPRGIEGGLVRSYATDSDTGSLEQRIVNIIVKRSADKTTAMNNVDRIRAQVRLYNQRITKLADDRRTGKLTKFELRNQLRELVKQIAAELDIGIRPGRPQANPSMWYNWMATHPGASASYGAQY